MVEQLQQTEVAAEVAAEGILAVVVVKRGQIVLPSQRRAVVEEVVVMRSVQPHRQRQAQELLLATVRMGIM